MESFVILEEKSHNVSQPQQWENVGDCHQRLRKFQNFFSYTQQEIKHARVSIVFLHRYMLRNKTRWKRKESLTHPAFSSLTPCTVATHWTASCASLAHFELMCISLRCVHSPKKDPQAERLGFFFSLDKWCRPELCCWKVRWRMSAKQNTMCRTAHVTAAFITVTILDKHPEFTQLQISRLPRWVRK